MKCQLLLFFTLVANVEAVVRPQKPKQPIELVFKKRDKPSESSDPNDYYAANFSIGTPAQVIPIDLQDLNIVINLRTGKINQQLFVPKSSKTFRQLANIKTPRGAHLVGEDAIQVGKTKLGRQPFIVQDPTISYNDLTRGEFALSRPLKDSKHHFLQSLLKAYRNQVVVIVLDKKSTVPTIKLTIGSVPKQCSKMQYMPVVDLPSESNFQWIVKLDSVQVGNFTAKNPLASFSVLDWGLSWPEDEVEPILKELSDLPGGKMIDCNKAKKEIVYKMGQFEFHIGPKDYLNWSQEALYNACFLADNSYTVGFYTIPSRFIEDKCLLLDFSNKRVGLSDRI